MSALDGAGWPRRLLRAASALLMMGAVVLWLTPINVFAGPELQPYGCGAPSSPRAGNLDRLVCDSAMTGSRYAVIALFVSAALLLLLSEVVAPRAGRLRAVVGAMAIAPIAVPLILLAGASLFSPVGTERADGGLIRCGTPLSPVTEQPARGTCGQLPERRQVLGFGAVTVGVLLLAGGAYVVGGARKPSSTDTQDPPSEPPAAAAAQTTKAQTTKPQTTKPQTTRSQGPESQGPNSRTTQESQ